MRRVKHEDSCLLFANVNYHESGLQYKLDYTLHLSFCYDYEQKYTESQNQNIFNPHYKLFRETWSDLNVLSMLKNYYYVAKKLSIMELMTIPEITKQLQDGKNQVQAYGQKLEKRFGNLRLQKFVVVALGFERICFEKLG